MVRVEETWGGINVAGGVAGMQASGGSVPAISADPWLVSRLAPMLPGVRVDILADFQPSELDKTIQDGDTSTSSLGPTSWSRISAGGTFAPDTTNVLRGAQSIKITNDTNGRRGMNIDMVETTDADLSLPTLGSGLDLWVYTPDVDKINELYIYIYEDSSGDRYRTWVATATTLTEYQGLVNNRWTRLVVPKEQFNAHSNGANYPSPWGWTDSDVSSVSYDSGSDQTTVTCNTSVFTEDMIGSYFRDEGDTTRYEVLAMSGAATGGKYAAIVVDGEYTGSSGDDVEVLYPSPTYPVYSIEIRLQNVDGETANLSCGLMTTWHSDTMVFSPQIDEPWEDGVTQLSTLLDQYGLTGRATFAVRTQAINDDTPSVSELAAYDANGYTICSHSHYHKYSHPAIGTCNISGSTVTQATGDDFYGFTTDHVIYIGGTQYAISSVDSDSQLTLTSAPGDGSGVDFQAGMTEEFMFAEHALGAAILRRAGLRRGMPMYGVLPNNGLGWVNGGTCTVADGVVTRTGGEPFFWGSNDDYLYRITIDGTEYSIDRTETMTADQVTLEDTSVTEASDVAWHIIGGVGIARTIYAMCATRAYGDTGQVRSGSEYMPAVAQDLSDIYRVLTANLADIDTADASGVTAREYMERAKAEGSLWVPYAHRIETSPTATSDAYLTYWQELIALAASYVSSGDAVVWNWDQLYAYYGQQAFDHTYYGKLSEGAW